MFITKIKNLFLLNCLFFIVNSLDTTGKNNKFKIGVPSAFAVPSSQSHISYLFNNNNVFGSPTIRHEAYKALSGETVRLECPQPNPTWFYRRLNNNVEDLIVTRHGIINADYKYKIMCHVTLKHQVIIINSIDFDEEGLYTCLYTDSSESSALSNDEMQSPKQYRHVFNVTVYTLISSLSMSVEPIKLQKQSLLKEILSIKQNGQKQSTEQYELLDSALTVRENEEFFINCNVESSRPAADVTFIIGNSEFKQQPANNDKIVNNHLSSVYVLSDESSSVGVSSSLSIVSSLTNVVMNNDQTFKTVQTTRIKANQQDHGKVLLCKAENGFSSQKWENKKLLNVLFAPICQDPPNFTYYIGINQTLDVECRILNANPNHVTYEWDLANINHGINGHPVLPLANLNSLFGMSLNLKGNPKKLNQAENDQVVKENKDILDERLNRRFKWRPNSINDFGTVKCKATNEIGSTECSYELKLGGIPNPPTDCTRIIKNSSAIISCQVGFHQGDPDIYCYLLRKSENGVYKEHTRNRESCSFIVNDVDVKKLNEFWIYSSNKHGHNKDSGVYLTIGQVEKQAAKHLTSNKPFMAVVGFIGLSVFIFLACCFCFKIRKGFSDESDDSVVDSDAYHTRGSSQLSSNGFISGKKLQQNTNGISSKMIKGVKIGNQERDNGSDSKDSKYAKPIILGNGAFTYTEPYSYTCDDIKNDFYSESLTKRLENEEKKNNSNKKQSFTSLFKKSPLHQSQNPNYFEKGPLKKERHVYNFSSNNSNKFTSSLQRTNNYQANKLDNSRLKNSISFTKNNLTNSPSEDMITMSRSFSINSGSGATSEDHDNKCLKELEPLFLNNNKNELTNLSKSGLLTTAIHSFNKATLKKKKSSSITPSSASSLSSSLNSINEVRSNKMVTFGNKKNKTNNAARTSSGNSSRTSGSSVKLTHLQLLNTIKKNNQQPEHNSIRALNMTSTTNTTVTTTASSVSSSTSPTTSSANQDEDNNVNLEYTNDHQLTVRDQSFGQNIYSQPCINNNRQSCNLSTFSPRQQQTQHIETTFRTPRCFVNQDNNKYENSKCPLLPSVKPLAISLLESSGSFTNGFSITNDKISDSLEAKFLNKLCEEIEVSLNVDCECADDYSSNDFSGDYSFDHDMKLSPMPAVRYNNNNFSNGSNNTARSYLNGNLSKNVVNCKTKKILNKDSHDNGQKPNSATASTSSSSADNSKSHLGVLV